MRERKPETIIRELKREMRQLCVGMDNAHRENETLRRRATKAEQDAAEWKRRFDALLERSPVVRVNAENT